MDVKPADPPEEFTELVRDALLHLYDLAYLQTHALVAIAAAAEPRQAASGKLLRQALLDAIGALHPGSGVAAASRAWRAYRILELRYVVGSEVDEVIGEVALSKRQYHREQHRALVAVASLLWERWQAARHWRSGSAVRPSTGGCDLARREAEHLLPGERAGQIDPREVLQGVASLVRPLCERLSVELLEKLPERLPAIRGDRVALRQALLSILNPAIAAAGGGVSEVAAASREQELELTVRGPGYLPEEVVRAADGECRPFVEALDGRLECPASQPGRWTIRLRFPANDRPALLVVDNNEDFISLVERYLAGHDWEVVGAPDVDRAFAVAQQRRPRAILLDVVIPGRDGWDLLLELKRTPATRDIPVIVCSVLHKSGMATALGAAAYLQKPIGQHELVETLETIAIGR